jgi:urease accessory protein
MFVAGMIAGAAIAWAGVALPWVEGAIAASVVVLGCLIAFLTRMPLAFGGTLVGLMAVFHGHAHGTEAMASGQAVTYALGFAAATLLLHAIGVGLGLGLSRVSTAGTRTRVAYGLGGAAIAGVGLVLLVLV